MKLEAEGGPSLRPRIVLLAGGTASGKTTLAVQLASTLDALMISHDRYYLDAPDPRSHNFDHPDSLETDLLVSHVDALRQGERVALPVYDFSTHTRRTDTEEVAPRPIVLVEGILVLSSAALRSRADLCIFVSAPEAVRFQRRLERDVTERGRDPDSVRRQYEASVRPMHERYVAPCESTADLVLDGTAQLAGQVARAVAAVQALSG